MGWVAIPPIPVARDGRIAGVVGCEFCRRNVLNKFVLIRGNDSVEFPRNGLGHFTLYFEKIGPVPIIVLGPDMVFHLVSIAELRNQSDHVAMGRPDRLRGHAR